MDKLLSLSLGRSSTLRDVDITLSRPANDMSDIDPRFVWPLSKWIDYSFLYGKIYEELFSPRALQQPESFRLKRVGELATELQLVFDSTNPAEVRRNALLESVLKLSHPTCTHR